MKASKELISDKLDHIRQTRDIFAAPQSPFPNFLTGSSTAVHPQQGVIDLEQTQPIPPSISTMLSISHPSISLLKNMNNAATTSFDNTSRNYPQAAVPDDSQDAMNKLLV